MEGLNDFLEVLKKQKYHLIENNAAVKKCRWLHKSLTENKTCYKQRFYGVQSHKCIQVAPTFLCNLKCRFCWRAHPSDIGLKRNHLTANIDADLIVEKSIEAQRKILTGYKSQVLTGKIDKKKYEESLNPRHAAISLDGEPTLYNDVDGLIRSYSQVGLTTFLVTNGTKPDVLKNLSHEPTQLYISIYAPNRRNFTAICRPSSKKLWNNVLKSLELMASFKCPSVVRLTLVKGLNMHNVKGYSEILKNVEPTYIEAKAYMYLGFSRLRLAFSNMPSYEDILSFSKDLSIETGYKLIDNCKESRVVLMSRLDKPIKLT